MKNEDKPYVENYPPLREWLKKINAVCAWQEMRVPRDDDGTAIGEPTQAVEAWTANGRVFIVIVHANRHGWEIYTAKDTVAIDWTLKDAEVRLGIVK